MCHDEVVDEVVEVNGDCANEAASDTGHCRDEVFCIIDIMPGEKVGSF